MHCKKDLLEWLRVSRWPFAVISIVTQKKKKKLKHCQCLEQRWKIILHHLIKLHAFMVNVANTLRINEKLCNAFYSIQMRWDNAFQRKFHKARFSQKGRSRMPVPERLRLTIHCSFHVAYSIKSQHQHYIWTVYVKQYELPMHNTYVGLDEYPHKDMAYVTPFYHLHFTLQQ